MPEHSGTKHKPMRIGLLGATFDTGNMGVSALAESTIKCILHKWPDAKIVLLGSGRKKGRHQLTVASKEIYLEKLPIRFCKNIFLDNHFVVLYFYALLLKVFPRGGLKRFCRRHNPSLSCILGMDIVADITGGDSFSDIYGFRRFFLGFLRKWLMLFYGKPLVMLPQTYGPFKRPLAKTMAKYILRKSKTIYSRDKNSIDYAKMLLRNQNSHRKVRFCPDVAFILDARRPEKIDIGTLEEARKKDTTVVGLNVSGLLFNGGYNRDNMFGLRSNYRELIYAVIEMLLKDKNLAVLLIPHVFPPTGYEVESDPDACLKMYEKLRVIYTNRIFLVKGEYDQGEIKYIIGLCDFFIGSRMHSCIAALSQCIPAVGLAYSKKFQGVFDCIDLSHCVVDARLLDKEEILSNIRQLFISREEIREHLKNTIPQVKDDVLSILN